MSFFRRPRSCCAVPALRVRTLPRIHGWRCQHSRSTFFHQHCRSHLIANRFQVSTVRSVFRIRCMVCPRPTVTRMLNPPLSPTFRTSFFINFIYSFDAAHTHSALPGQKRLIWLEGSAACDEIDFDNIQPHNAGGLRQALQRVVDLGSEAVLPVSSLTRANNALRILDAYVRQSPRALHLCRTVHPTLFVVIYIHSHTLLHIPRFTDTLTESALTKAHRAQGSDTSVARHTWGPKSTLKSSHRGRRHSANLDAVVPELLL